MRGQIWTMDYILGFLLFFVALLISLHYLITVAAQNDDFAELVASSNRLSEQLVATGYPTDWRADVVTPGLLTDGRFSPRKAALLLAHNDSASLLGTEYPYTVTLEQPNGTLLPITDECFIGTNTTTQQRVTFETIQSIAYYHRGGGSYSGTINGLNGTVFTDDELATLLANITAYDVVVMEEPNLADVAAPYDAEKAERLETFVRRGGILILAGLVNLSEAWNLTTLAAPSDNPVGTGSNDTLLNLSNYTLTNLVDARVLNVTGLRRYEPLAVHDDDTAFAARFTHGDGDVYYLGSVNGDVNETSEPLLNHLIRNFVDAVTVPTADCLNVTLPAADARHLVTVHRLVPYKGRTLTMNIYQWEAQR